MQYQPTGNQAISEKHNSDYPGLHLNDYHSWGELILDKNKNLNPISYLMRISKYNLTQDPMRKFILHASKRLGIEDRLLRYVDYINSIGNKCPDFSIINHYIDSVFMKVLENTSQLVVPVDNTKVKPYYRRRFTKALLVKDSDYLRWFFKYFVQSYTDVDAIVSENNTLLPCIFNYCFNICPAWGSTCVNGPTTMCWTGQDIGYMHVCCTSSYLVGPSGMFDLVDNPPWISTYSSGLITINGQASNQTGVLTLTGSVTIPSCFPSGGINLGVDLGVNYSNCSTGNCASSCPSGTNCCIGYAYQCGQTYTYSEAYYPILYYTINEIFLPNSSYSVWWTATVS